jgi:hypothetical protein
MTEMVFVKVTVLTYIQVVSGSNYGRVIGCPEICRGFT